MSMNKILILFSFLLTFIISDKDLYLPMNKDSKYGEDICRYYDDAHYYVKPCEKGKYCVDTSFQYSNLFVCKDIPKVKHALGLKDTDPCSTSFECDNLLECQSESCTYYCSLSSYFYGVDNICYPDSEKAPSSYCEYNKYDSNGNFEKTTYSSPEKNKICGKLNIKELAGSNHRGIYVIESKESVYKGSVKDGEYVDDMELCESGYALYFYFDRKHKDPKVTGSIGTNEQYLMCVTPISVDSSCSILYQLDGKEYVYNIQKLSTISTIIPSSFYSTFCGNDKDYISIKSERYREYYKNITEEERNTCGNLDGKDKFTCENRELIKSWYFYNNPKKYLLYNGREKLEKVLDHLIQMDYPSYYATSQFLNIQIFLFILFLLF